MTFSGLAHIEGTTLRFRSPYSQIWTSQLKRTIQSAHYLDGTIVQWKALNELDVVSMQLLTYAVHF